MRERETIRRRYRFDNFVYAAFPDLYGLDSVDFAPCGAAPSKVLASWNSLTERYSGAPGPPPCYTPGGKRLFFREFGRLGWANS